MVLELELLGGLLAFDDPLADFLPPECRGKGGESVVPLVESIWHCPSKKTPFSMNRDGVLMLPLTRPGL